MSGLETILRDRSRRQRNRERGTASSPIQLKHRLEAWSHGDFPDRQYRTRVVERYAEPRQQRRENDLSLRQSECCADADAGAHTEW
jgi:hypothetical protein